MSNTLFKKVSAAAIVAVLGAGAASQAAITPYSTGFEATEGYVPATGLTGQPLVGPTQWVNESDPFANSTVNVVTGNALGGTQAVQVNTVSNNSIVTNANGMFGPNHQTDVYNTATAFTAGQIGSSVVTVNFALNRAAPTGGQTTTVTAGFPFRNSYGVDVYDGSKTNLIAELFIGNSTSTPSDPVSVPALFEATGSGMATIVPLPAGAAAADGSYGNYSLNMNFGNHTFTVTSAAGTSAPFAFASSLNDIGGVYLAADSTGTNTAYFDNFSVVPEPASIAMIGIGSLMLVARRRRQMA